MDGDYVVILHGLGRTRFSMFLAEAHFSRNGYEVVNLSYPSLGHPIETLAEWLELELEVHCTDSSKKIHFLTHSLGGIVLRMFLEENLLPNLGRVVMLSPPNQGSELAGLLRGIPLFDFFAGPAAQQLTDEITSVPNQLGPVQFELGVIAGNRTFNLLGALLVSGQSDGAVAVRETQVAGMKDFIVVPCGHTFIMNHPLVLNEALHFIRFGRFSRNGS